MPHQPCHHGRLIQAAGWAPSVVVWKPLPKVSGESTCTIDRGGDESTHTSPCSLGMINITRAMITLTTSHLEATGKSGCGDRQDITWGEKQPKMHSSPTIDGSCGALSTMAHRQPSTSSSTAIDNSCWADSHKAHKSARSKEPISKYLMQRTDDQS
jgi:hypothetical protein